jgi:hypothetical protein
VIAAAAAVSMAFFQRLLRSCAGPVGPLHPLVAAILATALAAPGPASAADPSFFRFTLWAGVAAEHKSYEYDHDEYTGGGVVGDFDNDGLQDLFMPSGGRVTSHGPDYLFINNGDGTFSERHAEWGLTDTHLGKGASVGDFNNDGWLDIYVTSAGPIDAPDKGHHRLYRNNGNGSFTEIAEAAGVNETAPVQDGFGSTFGDYDLDGDLDLFVAGFAGGNAGNRLFRNNGDETFRDVTEEIGFFADTPISLKSFAPRFADMNGDRCPEMLLASDFGTSRYFRNNCDGTFTDITGLAGTGQDENGMGQNIGDWNGDGRFDWLVTSIYWPEKEWTGTKLYLNQGNHTYTDVAEEVGIDDGGFGWAALSVDFNHDGLLDIFETNGDETPAGGPFTNEQSYLWMLNEQGTFDERAFASGLVHLGRGRGLSNFDFDEDGDQDVVIFTYNETLSLFLNTVAGDDARWLRIFLDTSQEDGLAPNGHGAVVTATVDGVSQVRMITSGDNFVSHSELSAHFGLGTALRADLRVDWPDGRSTLLEGVRTNRTLRIDVAGEIPACDDGYDNDRDAAMDHVADDGCVSALDRSEVAGDLNLDRVLDDRDKDALFEAFGHSDGDPDFEDWCDFDRDGMVSFLDYQAWLMIYRAHEEAEQASACGLLGVEPLLVLAFAARRASRRRGRAVPTP